MSFNFSKGYFWATSGFFKIYVNYERLYRELISIKHAIKYAFFSFHFLRSMLQREYHGTNWISFLKLPVGEKLENEQTTGK